MGYPVGGEITYESLGELNAQLAGNCGSLFTSLFIIIPWALLFPQNYDWAELRKLTDANIVDPALNDTSAELDAEGEDSPAAMDTALRWTIYAGSALTLILIILWPCLAIPAGHFTASYWSWWVSLAMIWCARSGRRGCALRSRGADARLVVVPRRGLVATISCILLPIWEARAIFIAIANSLIHGHLPEGHEYSVHVKAHAPKETA